MHWSTVDAHDDPSWYALRNVVYASGCRIKASKTESYLEACEASWGYFENALSVYADLLFLESSMVAMQALVLMVTSRDRNMQDGLLTSTYRRFLRKESAAQCYNTCSALTPFGLRYQRDYTSSPWHPGDCPMTTTVIVDGFSGPYIASSKAFRRAPDGRQ